MSVLDCTPYEVTLMTLETRGKAVEEIENGVLYGEAIESPAPRERQLHQWTEISQWGLSR
jgi:hypothetical protein